MFKVAMEYERAKKTKYNRADEESVEGKVVVITGSNSGIGQAAALEMAKRKAIVVMACRDLSKAEKVLQEIKTKSSNSHVELIGLDLGDLDSVRNCAQQIREKYDHINILINNAGVFYGDGKPRKTKDGFEMHMGVNHLGHFLFTMLLLDLVKKAAPSRIVMVSSMGFQLSELDINDLMLEKRGVLFGPLNLGPYANSKMANMYFASALAKELTGTGVTTYSLCPGRVKTDIARNEARGIGAKLHRSILPTYAKLLMMIGSFMALTPEKGAETIMFCSLSKNCAQGSGNMHRWNSVWNGAPGKYLNDVVKEAELWRKSMELVGLAKI